MIKGRVHLVSLVALLFSALTISQFAGYSSVLQETKPQDIFAGDPWLTEIANYRHWQRVNDVPLPVSFSLESTDSLARGGTFI